MIVNSISLVVYTTSDINIKLCAYLQKLNRFDFFPRITKFIRFSKKCVSGQKKMFYRYENIEVDSDITSGVLTISVKDNNGNPLKGTKVIFIIEDDEGNYYIPEYAHNNDYEDIVLTETGKDTIVFNLKRMCFRDILGNTGKLVKFSHYKQYKPAYAIYASISFSY